MAKKQSTEKEILKTKTFWIGVISIALGIFLHVSGETVSGVQLIMLGLGLLGLRDAIRKLQ